MATGTDTYGTFGVPLLPATGFTITQRAASTDVDLATLKRGPSSTASWLALQDSDGTQRFAITKNAGIAWRVRTTRPTTGLLKGEMFVVFHNSLPKIAVCSSTAAQTVKMINVRMKTFGRRTVASLA
jgi:hypothetical protein